MPEILNLRRARKAKLRADREAEAAQRRAAFGTSKAERKGRTCRAGSRRSEAGRPPPGRPRDPTRPSLVTSPAVEKHSVRIAGHRTSVSLETAFWTRLCAIAAARGVPLAALVGDIDAGRGTANLSSALRVFVLNDALRGAGPSSGAAAG